MVRPRSVTPPILIGHLLFWLTYIGFLAVSFGWEETDQFTFHLMPNMIVGSIPVTIALTYLNLYGLMPRWYKRQQYPAYALALLGLLLAGGLLVRWLTFAFILPWEQVHDPQRYQLENKEYWIPVRILRLSLEAAPVMALTMVIKLMNDARIRERQLREIQQEKFTAEMGLLKAQVNPHFLFNTLNSLYALSLKRSDTAPAVILRLSGLMQYMLYDAASSEVLLADELAYLQNYIAIEELRFAPRLQLTFHQQGDLKGRTIAPMLLLPLVENAFKHGIEEEAGWITIHINATGTHLLLTVRNSCPVVSASAAGGLGLANLKKRLALLYPDTHELHLSRTAGIFEANLLIQL